MRASQHNDTVILFSQTHFDPDDLLISAITSNLMTVAPIISSTFGICLFFLPFSLSSLYYWVVPAGHQASCCSACKRQLCFNGVNHLNKQDEQLIKFIDSLDIPHKERINMILYNLESK